MTYTFVKPGRGAWTIVGGYLKIRPTSTNPAGFMRAPIGAEAMVGSHFARGQYRTFPYEVVYEAVKAYQRMIGVEADGLFGPATDAGTRQRQRGLGLDVDGVLGPATMLGLLRPYVSEAAHQYGVVVTDIGGIAAHESSWDLGAVGTVTGSDVGCFQINLNAAAAKGFTIAEVVDPSFAAHFTARDMADFYDHWVPKVGENLARAGSIANHNSPAQAELWMKNKAPQTTWIAQYVADVRDAGKVF